MKKKKALELTEVKNNKSKQIKAILLAEWTVVCYCRGIAY